ncbi:hypothetical protein L484_024198 [Morus notabilis]|uniref:Uncharacterized protein n=1 Tax=Morus notabilis TaxID=981085 RepID=W9RM03_9ROSA|nr:hypothetical protein L484_024198 [Morus notabilis]
MCAHSPCQLLAAGASSTFSSLPTFQDSFFIFMFCIFGLQPLRKLVPVIGQRAVLGLSGYVINNIAFVFAAVYFYQYSESLYALFSIGGLYHLISGRNNIVILWFALSGFASLDSSAFLPAELFRSSRRIRFLRFPSRLTCAVGAPPVSSVLPVLVSASSHQERKLGARRRSDTVLVSTINDADQGSADVAFRTPLAPYEKSKFLGSRGSMVARLKLKGIDGRAPPGVEPVA